MLEPVNHVALIAFHCPQVNLIATKVLNPLIHLCEKCDCPILAYGRMVSSSEACDVRVVLKIKSFSFLSGQAIFFSFC